MTATQEELVPQFKIGDRAEFLSDVSFGDIDTKSKNPDAKLALRGETAEVCGVRGTRLALSVGGELFDWPIRLVKRISGDESGNLTEPKTRGEEILSEQRQQALSKLKNGRRYWDATSHRFGNFAGAQKELAQLVGDDDKTFTACPTKLCQANLWEGLRVQRARWGNGTIDRWHPYTGGWWVIWDGSPDCACQDDLLAPAIAVGEKFALSPGVTQEFEVMAIVKGKKPYQIKWKHGPDETYQVDLEFFRRFKRVVENDRWNPNDFESIDEFNRAWEEWEQRDACTSESEKLFTIKNGEQSLSMTEFKKGDTVAPAWPAGRGRRGVVERVEKNFAHIDWANGTSGKVRFDQLLLVARAKESLPTPFWRVVFGLHPCDQPPTEDSKDHIRCDTFPIEQQIRICQERIFQQNWRIQDLKAQPKQSKDLEKTIESAKSNIAFEEGLIDLLLPQFITYRESIDSGVSEDESKKTALATIASQIQLPEFLISNGLKLASKSESKSEVPEKLKFAYHQLRQRGMNHQEALNILGSH